MVVRVHVNLNKIRANAKHGTKDPVITIRKGSKTEYANEVELLGSSRVVYSPDKPLKCGAKVWIECEDARAVL